MTINSKRKLFFFLSILTPILFLSINNVYGQITIKERIEIQKRLPSWTCPEECYKNIIYAGKLTITSEEGDLYVQVYKIDQAPSSLIFQVLFDDQVIFSEEIIGNWEVSNEGETVCTTGGPLTYIANYRRPENEILVGYLDAEGLLPNGEYHKLKLRLLLDGEIETQTGIQFSDFGGIGNLYFPEETQLYNKLFGSSCDVVNTNKFKLNLIPGPVLSIIPAQDTVLASTGSTEINIYASDRNEPGFDPDFTVDIGLSDSSLGHFAIIEENELGIKDTVAVGSSLQNISYEDLDPDFRPITSSRYVSFIAKELNSSSKSGGESEDLPKVQILANHSINQGIAGIGTIIIKSQIVNIELLDSNGTIVEYLQIARWDNGYDLGATPDEHFPKPVLNGDSSFVILDPEHFTVRIVDTSANLNASAKDSVEVQIGTLFSDGGEDDQSHDIFLRETESNSAIFESAPQLLVTQDFFNLQEVYVDLGDDNEYLKVDTIMVVTDDQYMANNGMALFPGWTGVDENGNTIVAGPVPDNSKTDPTHKAVVGGSLSINYTAPSGLSSTETFYVCEPDEIRYFDYEIVVFEEPYDDNGFFDSNGNYIEGITGEFDWEGKGNGLSKKDAFMNRLHTEVYADFSTIGSTDVIVAGGQVQYNEWNAFYKEDELIQFADRVKLSFAQLCIVPVWDEEYNVEPAPINENGESIFLNGQFDFVKFDVNDELSFEDLQLVFEQYKPNMSSNKIVVFLAPPLNQVGLETGGTAVSKDLFSSYIDLHDNLYSYAIVSSASGIGERNITHEILHLLTRLGGEYDEPRGLRHNMFPSNDSGMDVDVNINRRIQQADLSAILSSPLLYGNATKRGGD